MAEHAHAVVAALHALGIRTGSHWLTQWLRGCAVKLIAAAVTAPTLPPTANCLASVESGACVLHRRRIIPAAGPGAAVSTAASSCFHIVVVVVVDALWYCLPLSLPLPLSR